MGKIVFILIVGVSLMDASTLEQHCLACHKAQQIPSELIYRRYLSRYSTEDAMAQAIAKYLKHPQKSKSIMPPQFFLKFPMKEPISTQHQSTHQDIRAFLEMFDVKKRLMLR